MRDRSSKRNPTDLNQLAKSIVDQTISQHPPDNQKREKNPAAVALGRLGGLRGGKARAEKLCPRKKSEIARKAAKARWSQVDRHPKN